MRIAILLKALMFALAFGQQTQKLSSLPEPLRDDVIPYFSVIALDNEPNSAISSNDMKKFAKEKGKKRIVLLLFATWCKNCEEEFVILKNNLNELEKNGIQVYLIDVSESNLGESGVKVENFVKQFAGDFFPFYFDPNSNLPKDFGFILNNQTQGELPITIVLDSDLKILFAFKAIGNDYPQVLWSEL